MWICISAVISTITTRTPKEIDGTIFCNDSPGFSVLTADKNNLRLNMLDKEGKAIYVVSRAK